MAGFNSPNILFLNTYDTLDRKYIKELAPKLRGAGYDRYVELYCGAFVMPLIVAAEGYPPEKMNCYDISLFSNIMGYVFSGKDLAELEVRKDGELIPLTGKDASENAGILMYEQAFARLKKAEGIIYFHYLLEDMEENRQKHIDAIAEKVRKMDASLHGLHFERLYIWEAFEKEKDSPNTFICSNPPTYKGAYEKFFDTDGVITWAGDDYEYQIWDGSVDCPKLMQEAEGHEALLMLLQQANKGKAATEEPVSARFLSMTQNVYWNTNHPDVVKNLISKKAETANGAQIVKSKYSILPPDYKITKDAKIDIFVEEPKVAEYYRKIWLHRIRGKSVSIHLCVLLDGMIAGFIGLDFNAIVKPYRETDRNTVVLSYAVPSPNDTCRNARLLVELVKSKKVILDGMNRGKKPSQFVMYATIADSICTVEYTKYHEVKGLRGLMKIKRKEKKAENLFALTYFADLNENSAEQCLANFVDAEERYNKKCQKK